ncbi:MAG: hypothetical protein HN560_17470, partial [Anaerolineae bacterium]|nr:hypothetical protein [Anaerolineae bacterium]
GENLFNDMISKKDVLPTYDKPDQGFLNSYFENEYYKLDMKYNVLKRIFVHHKEIWNDIKDDMYCLHFVGKKPWQGGEDDYRHLSKLR